MQSLNSLLTPDKLYHVFLVVKSDKRVKNWCAPGCFARSLCGLAAPGSLPLYGTFDELKANFPRRVCTSRLKRKISLACAAVSPDVARTGPTCMFMSCPLLWTTRCALHDGSSPTGMGTPVSAPLPTERIPYSDPQTERTEPLMGWLGAAGMNRNEGGRDAQASLNAYVPSLSSVLFRARTLIGNISVDGSAMYEPKRQISAYRLTALSTDPPVKSFARCLTFMFWLAQVFMTSSCRAYRTTAAWRIPMVSFLEGRDWLYLGSRWCCVRIVCTSDWGFNNPTLTRPEISISVKRSKSPAAPGNSVSVLANGPTVKNGAPLLTGVRVWCHMTTRNYDLWNELVEKCTPLRIRRLLRHLSLAYSRGEQSRASNWWTSRTSAVKEQGWLCGCRKGHPCWIIPIDEG